ncbi:MAG TPA: hypothetical protein VMF50_12045 [Candidatus Binataceae bacterium]|nr:hypothetical protein [Candidatus Binataceae bacterium]
MSIPVSGIVLIPLALVIFFFAPHRLGQLAIIAAVFAAASVINFGGGSFLVGIAPFYFVALLIAIRCLPKWLNYGLQLGTSEPLRRYLQVLSVFVTWAVLSAFIFPILFNGLPVDLGRAGPDATFYTRLPLHWSFSNGGQAGYLILDLIVVFYLVERTQGPDSLIALCSAFSLSGLIVVAVGAYQFIAHHFGLPFPREFLNSNPAWAQLTSQNLDGASRISATFDESSGAGSFLAAWVTFELILAGRYDARRWRHLAFALAGILIVIGTTSTTGYVTTAIMLLFLLSRELFALIRGRSSAPAIAVIAMISLLGIALFCAFTFTGAGHSLVSDVLLNKAESGSSLHRMATVMRSFHIFSATFGLGAGLGSNRAMSLAAYILSNLGVVGVVLFAWLMLSLIVITRSASHAGYMDTSQPVWHFALVLAFGAHLLALTESGAEISDPVLWLLWGIILASIRLRLPVDLPFSFVTAAAHDSHLAGVDYRVNLENESRMTKHRAVLRSLETSKYVAKSV